MRYSLLLLLLVGGCTLFHSEAPLPDTPQQHIIFSIDRTRSMALSDPDNISIDFAGAVSTLLPPRSVLSALVMGKQQRTLIKTRRISSRADRMKTEKYLRKEPLSGRVFDPEDALNRVTQLFKESSAPPSLVFISDGYNRGRTVPKALIETLSKKKCVVNAVAVTPKENLPLLSSMSSQTGGALIRPDSITDFFPFLQKLYPGWRLFRAHPEVGAPKNTIVVPPATYRLFIITKRGPGNAYLKGIFFTDRKRRIPRTSRYVSAYPYRADKVASVFDVVNIERPPAGICRLSFSAKPEEYAVWALLPVSVKTGALADTVKEGEEIGIRVTVSADNEEALPILNILKGNNLTAKIVSESRITETLTVPLFPAKGKKEGNRKSRKSKETNKKAAQLQVLFESRVRLYLRKRTDEPFSLLVRAALRYPKYTLWLCEQKQSFLVKVAEVPVKAEPSEVKFAPAWIDEPPAAVTLKLQTEYPHNLRLSLKDAPGWVSVTPSKAVLSSNKPVTLSVSVSADQKAIAGERSGVIMLDVKTEDGSDFAQLSIPVSAVLLKLTLKKNVKTLLHPGKEFDIVLGEPIEPSVPLEMEVEKEEKSKIKPLMLHTKDGKLCLHVWVDEDAKDERTIIRLTIQPKGYEVSPKGVTIDALVRAAPEFKVEPSKVALKIEKEGEYEVKLKVTVHHYEEVEMSASVSDLLGKGKHKILASAGEVKITEKVVLQPDKPTELKLQFTISTDILNGIYKGEASVVLKYHKGERHMSFKIPIELEIKK